jgi:multisubunit Na+/H+ antiporter MnhB subunit
MVADRLAVSGVEHPVTAVLLNFRGYDTLLEIAVLLVAVTAGLGTRQMQPDGRMQMDESTDQRVDNALLNALLHGLLPLLVLVAAALYWAGSYRPGGAFHAGAVLAAGGVLLRLVGIRISAPHRLALRTALVGGFTFFLLVATAALALGLPLLTYPDGWAGPLILAVEAALSISIGIILLSLFAEAPPAPRAPGEAP